MTGGAKTPTSDHIVRFVSQLKEGWSIGTKGPNGQHSHYGSDEFRAALIAALTPLKGAPAGYLFELCYSHAHDRWSGTMYGETLPNPEDVRNVRPLVFASQPLPETEEKALAREEILHAFFGAGKDIVKAGGGAPSRWDYRKLQDAWQAARDLLARGDAA